MSSIKIIIKIFSLIIFRRVFNPGSLNYIFSNSFYKKSFNFPQSDSYSFSKAFKYLLKTILLTPTRKEIIKFNSNSIVFDTSKENRSRRLSYVSHFSKNNNLEYTFYSEYLYFQSVWDRIIITFFLSLFFPIILFILLLNKKDRASISLIYEYIVFLSSFTKTLSLNKVDNLYQFSIFINYSNLLTFLVHNLGVKIYKITSDVPILIWNKLLFSTNLILCNKLQLEELKDLNSKIVYDNYTLWGPEKFLEMSKLYTSQRNEFKYNIGYVSTAGWLRKRKGNIDQGFNIIDNEIRLLKVLKNYSIKNNEVLPIYLHPSEKKIDFINETKSFYKMHLKGCNYVIITKSTPNHLLFNEFSIAISYISTLMFERLFFGYKCIFFNPSNNFFSKNSIINNICANSENEISKLIIKISTLSKSDFQKFIGH